MNSVIKFLRDEEGATAIEYGLIAGLLAVVIIAAIALLSGGLTNLFTGIANKLTNTGAAIN